MSSQNVVSAVSQPFTSASGRKSRMASPFPLSLLFLLNRIKLPRRWGRRVPSPNSRIRAQPALRTQSRAKTAPLSLSPPAAGKLLQTRGYRDRQESNSIAQRRLRKEQSPSPLREAINNAADFDDDPLRWDNEQVKKTGGGDVASLEEAVADFDVALRNHRAKHRGLLDSATPMMTEHCPHGIENNRAKHDNNAPNQSGETTSWFDREATSTPIETLGSDDLRELPWCKTNNLGGIPSGGNPGTDIGNQDAARVARTEQIGQSHMRHTSENVVPTNGKVEGRMRVVDSVEGNKMPQLECDQRTDVVIGHMPAAVNTSTPTFAQQEAQVNTLRTTGAMEQQSHPSHLHGCASPGAGLLGANFTAVLDDPAQTTPDGAAHSQEPLEAHHGNSGFESDMASMQQQPSPSPTTKGGSVPKFSTTPEQAAVNNTSAPTESLRRGFNAAGGLSGDQSFQSSVPIVKVVETVPKNGEASDRSGGNGEASQQVVILPAETESGTETTGAVNAKIAPAVSVASPIAAQAVVAPAITAAMESPDRIATVEQRTAGDWMAGTINGRPQDPLTVAEAEAELAERVERLQSKQLAAEREERDALEKERTRRFGQEQASRSASFAEEDRQALAAEERRLADIRREADLGRLQRGAEFGETDNALNNEGVTTVSESSTGATIAPVRGMRPQHYNEAEDLPDGVRQAAAPHPAENVLDEMEDLEARAKAAGRGMKVEEFEVLEQRQRARQVERLEILHGQTAKEKADTMLNMAVRLQIFVRSTIAKMRVARLRNVSAASTEKVRMR